MHTVPKPPSDRPSATRGAAIASLARLPVFVDLHGKRALVAGGSDAAAWKIRLLLSAGARVQVCSTSLTLSEACKALLDAHIDTGELDYCDRHWAPGDFQDMAIAVIDASSDMEADAFCVAARNAGVPSNAIDNAAFGTFEFGSVVNRSPVVVGISSAGAAPSLTQSIRQRIEVLLPPALANWAGIARRIRSAVRERLADAGQRRQFWRAFSERAFLYPPTGDDEAYLTMPEPRAPGETEGCVTLVGAGPGDAQLLTVKAVRALQAADVILFDDLVSDEVLELARREAKRMLVGKRGGRESCSQADINELMVKLAKAGRRVVRLKSGDPMIFGRAGEEIARLQSEGITVDVVPGITAALAMASTLGVSLTHRDCAQSVRFVTGHSRDGELPSTIDWRALADPHASTVFYMGGRTAGRIADALLTHAMPGHTPVVICAAVSRPNEARWQGSLSTLAQGIAQIGVAQPVLIAVGQVFGTQQSLPTSGRVEAM